MGATQSGVPESIIVEESKFSDDIKKRVTKERALIFIRIRYSGSREGFVGTFPTQEVRIIEDTPSVIAADWEKLRARPREFVTDRYPNRLVLDSIAECVLYRFETEPVRF